MRSPRGQMHAPPRASHRGIRRSRNLCVSSGAALFWSGQAERYVVAVQELEDFVGVPALVAKLERTRIAARQHVQE